MAATGSWYAPSTLTWAVAKSRVANVIGASADDSMKKLAGYALEEAIHHWNSYKDWKYTLVTEQNIQLNAGVSSFSVTPYYKKTYDIRLVTPIPRILVPSSKREHDVYNPNQTLQGTPQAYHLRDVWWNPSANTDSPGKVVVFPTPDAVCTLDHSYYIRHVIPADISGGLTTSDGTTVDFPLRFQTALLALAKMYFLGDRGSDENLQFWTQMAMDSLQRARHEDEWTPDKDATFVPGVVAYRRPYDPNDITPFLGEW